MAQVTKLPVAAAGRKKKAHVSVDDETTRSAQTHPSPVADLTTVSNAPQDAPQTLEKALGLQVRTLRRQRDLSASELGQAANISLGMVSKIENGQSSPSLSTMNSLAKALDVPLSSLFSTLEEKRDCSYVEGGKGVIIERRGTKVGHIYELLGASLGGDLVVEPYLITLEDDAEPYPAFHHSGIELIYMLTGEVIYRHSNHDYHLKPGDSLMFDSSGLHGPVQHLRTPSTYVAVIIYPRPFL
ncbi:helix-turn-helix domain-containing protein [Methylobacterium sp.]|uniref:helix-turn-helix domain-containing protein n=1 Tax=Methylobacterium sp. TaxID=409 RepID=UPI003B5BA2BE